MTKLKPLPSSTLLRRVACLIRGRGLHVTNFQPDFGWYWCRDCGARWWPK